MCIKGDVFLSTNSFGYRITQLAASQAAADDDDDCVGFLMASTLYSIYWFRVTFVARGTNFEKPVLDFLGSKLFKTSCVAHICWNPHLPEESLVLLESGQLFLFDMNDSRSTYSIARFRGRKLLVSWDEYDKLAKGRWLSCEFTWHPRILVVAKSDAVFLADFRFDKCSVDCLMKIELLNVTDAVKKDQFVAFSKAGSDGFFYVVASECWLVLIDIRAPCKPMLLWLHGLHHPRYVSVFPLSELRGNLGNDEFNHASKISYAIVLGSFWTGDFNLFCYGPSLPSQKQPISSNKAIKVSTPFYAWDLPSDLSLSGLDCLCSSCLVRGEFLKEDLPEWIDWQQKKQLALGFFILNKDVSSLMSKSDDEDAGFVLIRLMSSGKLESQRFSACWNMSNKVEPTHVESPFNAKDFHLYSKDDEEYRFQRMFKYIRLEYLYAYMNGSLTNVLFSKFKRLSVVSDRSKPSAAPSHEFISEKLKTCGLTESTSSFSVSDAIKDISMPTSVYEAASKRLWTRLPVNILGMAFSTYEECFGVLIDSKKVFLDFSAVPDQNHLPPFILRKPSERSNKWSKRVKPGDDFVGPVIPLSISITLKEIRENGRSYLDNVNQFSPDTEITRESQNVLNASREMCVSHSNIDVAEDYSVSLFKDSEETWDASRIKNLYLYKPSAFSDALPGVEKDVGCHDHTRYTTMIAKVRDDKHGSDTSSDGSKFFDYLCPFDLNFDDSNEWNVGSKEMHSYTILKELFKKRQQNFRPYTDFCAQFKS